MKTCPIRRLGVKWPMLCQRDKPEPSVRLSSWPGHDIRVRHAANGTLSVSCYHCEQGRGGGVWGASHQHQRQFLLTPHRNSMQEVPQHHSVFISQSCSQSKKTCSHLKHLFYFLFQPQTHIEKKPFLHENTHYQIGVVSVWFADVRHPGDLSSQK